MKNIKISKSILNSNSDTLNLYFKDIYKYKPLTQEEENALAKEHSESSLNELVKHNLRFVVTVAKQYQNQGLTLEDLIAEGNYGLIEASKRFDPSKGTKFISYAVFWIKQAIITAIYTKGRTIKSPISFISLYQKINKTIKEFEENNGHEPSYEELSEILDIEPSKIVELMSRYSKFVSLDLPISDDFEGSTLIDVVENKNVISPDEEISSKIKSEMLKRVISHLSKRETYVIEEYFGLFGKNSKSFEEIGKNLKLTGERIRQIKNKAINKLKDRFGDSLKTILQ